MQEEIFITFCFKTNEFRVPMKLDVLMNQKISRSLFINRRYYFESDVSLEVFKSFIEFWATGIYPTDCINKDNFIEHEMLSEELQIESISSIIDTKRREFGEELINISKIQNPIIKDKSITEEEISKSFDDYVLKHGNELIKFPIQTLFNIIKNKQINFTEHNHFYELIKQQYETSNDKNIFLLLQLIDFEKLNSLNQKESILNSAERNSQVPHINIMKLLETIDQMKKSISMQLNYCDINKMFYDTSVFRFQEKNLIGRGNFGRVYALKNIKNQKMYAFKILTTNGNFDSHDQASLIRYSFQQIKLKHPGFAKFKGITFQSLKDSTIIEPAIITKFYSKGSLRNILQQELLSLADIEWNSTKKIILLIGIANAMKYLHEECSIIHIALHPENILLDDNLYPIITDAGFSNIFQKKLFDIRKPNEFLYMAPEILSGINEYTKKSDVYAYAMIAYEIITRKEPFSDYSEKWKTINKIVDGIHPDFPEFVPKKMQQLISLCWSCDPNKRPLFDYIYKELSTDFSYFGDDFDKNEVLNYIDILSNTN